MLGRESNQVDPAVLLVLEEEQQVHVEVKYLPRASRQGNKDGRANEHRG